MPRCPASSILALIAAGLLAGCGNESTQADRFLALMNAGKNYLDQGDATNALATYAQALQLAPNDPDLHLNIANGHLLAGHAEDATHAADTVLQLEPHSAAAYFIKGSAHLRLAQFEEAVEALENAKTIDPGETATCFQLGRARMGLEQWTEAITAFQAGLALDPNRFHSAARYLMAQCLIRAGRQQEAEEALALHQANVIDGGPATGAASFERSPYTRARVPFRLDQPEQKGIRMKFADATTQAFGAAATGYSGPTGVIDVNHDGRNSLFVREQSGGFRLLWNTNGTFHPDGSSLPARAEDPYDMMLVGDLQNDRFEDVIVLGATGSRLFRFATNGVVMDGTSTSALSGLQARDGLLMDLDFTGKLDLVALTPEGHQVQVRRQSSPLLFTNITETAGIPDTLRNAHTVVMTDWNRDEMMDLIIGRTEGPPLLLEKQRGGPLVPRAQTNWPSGAVLVSGDFDNDLRPDLVVRSDTSLSLCFNGGERREIPVPPDAVIRQLIAVDHDQDGWLDLWAIGKGAHAWRNLGQGGFEEQTAKLGLDTLSATGISGVRFADFDADCDSDVVVALAGGGLRYLRNDGGNANAQVKVRLVGNRSNASGIGCKIEIETGRLRLIRTVHSLPVEVGVGRHQTLDSFLVHWFNWPQGSAQVPVDCLEPLFALELTIQEGSCPYLYAWDGKQFRFVTDILGASPLGLPLTEGRRVASDPEEWVWIGNEASFPPRGGSYQLQITEELREALYLDLARLVVVDHPPGTEAHPIDKLLPDGPFPEGTLMTLHREHPLRQATTLDGRDATARLAKVDGQRLSPPALRPPQLRGLAEPHGVILDFGPLDAERPLVLVMNGWLRFGGGMANIAASHDPTLPFPFPVLEMETAPDQWRPVEVTVGAPAGKTKTIVVELDGKLATGTRRLRLIQAFEIHWDRIALLERQPDAATQITFVPPTSADLHWRGFSPPMELPSNWPITPDYNVVHADSPWTLIPGGWCTRYGDVLELVSERDEGLAIVNSGDELTLTFRADLLPAKPKGMVRDFFLLADGWDKDSDFHVIAGSRVEPLPFHGMDDQRYGREPRPLFPSDALHRKYNTRWVEGRVLRRTVALPKPPWNTSPPP